MVIIVLLSIFYICFVLCGGYKVNWNVTDPNPDWNVDQLRVYEIKKLERQIKSAVTPTF